MPPPHGRRSTRRRVRTAAPLRRRLAIECLEEKTLLAYTIFPAEPGGVPENDRSIRFVIQRDGDLSQPANLGYATSPGSATEGLDYVGASGTVSFSPGISEQEILVQIVDDTFAELTEDFLVTLFDGFGTNTTGLILDDGDTGAPVPEIEVFDAQMTSLTDNVAHVHFGTTTLGTPVNATFQVRNVGGSVLNLNAITLPAGFSLFAGFGDTTLETNESTFFTIRLNAAAVGFYSGTLQFGNNDTNEDPYNFTISGDVQNAPPPPTRFLSINDYTVSEGGIATFTVSLSSPAPGGQTISVQYATQDAPPSPNGLPPHPAMSQPDCRDHIATSGTLFFSGSTTQLMVTVNTIQETLPEENERFFVNLSNASGPAGVSLQISDAQGVGTIPANDGPVDNGVQLLVTAPDFGNTIDVKLFDSSHPEGGPTHTFPAYPGFQGGVRVATGDVGGDGKPDVITGAGTSGGPHVKVFDGQSLDVAWQFFAYGPEMTMGIFVASGDVNGDGIDDIITAPDVNAGPHVRVWDGATRQQLASIPNGFMAYNPNFTGGVRVAAGDVNGDGRAEVITVAGPGAGSHVIVWNLHGGLSALFGFFAYDPSFTGGAYVAAADRNHDGKAEIITGSGPGMTGQVRVFFNVNGSPVLQQLFEPYTGFGGGIRVSVGDMTGAGDNHIVTAPGPGGGSHIRGWAPDAALLCGFFAYPGDMTQGVFVAQAPPARPNIVAHTPQTTPFMEREIPASRENIPGVGIRRNGDDDNTNGVPDASHQNVAGENDLIRVRLDVGTRLPSALYYLRKDNNNVQVWGTSTKQSGSRILDAQLQERLVPFSSTARSFSYWVEWIDVGAGASGTQSILTLEARSIATGAILNSSTVRFIPFNSIVIALGGNTQVPADPTIGNHGTFQSAIDLYADGYDVHMYRESDVAAGSGVVYTEVVSAIQKRGVSNVAIFGYSQGGGATYVLDNALNANRAAIGNFTIKFTAYIDAVRHTGPSPEDRRPVGTVFHANYWQSFPTPTGFGFSLLGASIPGSTPNIDVRTDPSTPWGVNLDHNTIDDHINVRNAIKSLLKTQVPNF